MEDAGDTKNVTLSLDNDDPLPGRARSGSTSNGHKRSSSGSLLSKFSFLRMNTGTHQTTERSHPGGDKHDAEEFNSGLQGGRAMSSALQQRRTRRRRGSLRKTALLGTRFDHRDKKTTRATIDVLRADGNAPPRDQTTNILAPSVADSGSTQHQSTSLAAAQTNENNANWGLVNEQRGTPTVSASQRPRKGLSTENVLGDEIGTDDEDMIALPRVKNAKSAIGSTFGNSSTSSTSGPVGLRIPTPPSSSDSYYALPTDASYRAVHRTKSPLATHVVDLKPSQEIIWDYSETEWWGWIILIVTWLVFVVGMGSCFGVWSWAWDVGETPYAPPELEDDPTLPIVGYYPALIILTAVMSWVWVVVAWVGMKYFKHANITGDDT
ncbi:uncharacterized protein C227.19c [Aspergillus udagawae]|uniref:Uncharacterized protein n=1 Tax=Aspergillus udagawae TaxID=91492 RepID=A0A8H3SHR1_9EURO|nr:uncharacterized protein Aud_008364 [Aspergillus udagawae]GFF23108.1 uncharacterized protein C227.19c [Aspergillus udagawae]GFF60939.1 uncharacterized protein C227.19c [Aspergillus udagawae]GFG18949.1 uncharacterized protein C227.19c [Aspergillus udagawae]GIC91910.1 hypothetical protein Aud_008364 [Aspergillus udagawae]